LGDDFAGPEPSVIADRENLTNLDKWILSRLSACSAAMDKNFKDYKIGHAT